MIRTGLFLSAILIAALGVRAAGAEVLIGLATALTGPVAWEGASSQVGAEHAVAELNAKGGVLGERIEMLVVDDACAPDQAVLAARKLIDARVVAVIGHHCSAASIPASQLYAEAGTLMISPFSTNPKLTEQGFPTVFRALGRDDRQGEMAGDLLAERFGGRPIAILHDGTVYGQGLAGYTNARLNERGIAEAMFEAIEPGQLDYSDVIRSMRDAGAEILYYAGYTQEAGLIFRQVRDSGYDLQLVVGDAVAAEDFALIAGPAADGTLMTYGPAPRRQPRTRCWPSASPPQAMPAASAMRRSTPMPSSRPGRRRSSVPARSRPMRSRRSCTPISSIPCWAGSASTIRAT